MKNNKKFAYVDFDSKESAEKFIAANHKRKVGTEKIFVTFNKSSN